MYYDGRIWDHGKEIYIKGRYATQPIAHASVVSIKTSHVPCEGGNLTIPTRWVENAGVSNCATCGRFRSV